MHNTDTANSTAGLACKPAIAERNALRVLHDSVSLQGVVTTVCPVLPSLTAIKKFWLTKQAFDLLLEACYSQVSQQEH